MWVMFILHVMALVIMVGALWYIFFDCLLGLEWLQAEWAPVEYDGIEFIRVPSNKIWRPDIVLYNK